MGDLAEKWESTLDDLTYIFHLRRDAYWHDGTPVTADDVIFTLSILQDPAFAGPPEVGAAVWQAVRNCRVFDSIPLNKVIPPLTRRLLLLG